MGTDLKNLREFALIGKNNPIPYLFDFPPFRSHIFDICFRFDQNFSIVMESDEVLLIKSKGLRKKKFILPDHIRYSHFLEYPGSTAKNKLRSLYRAGIFRKV